MAIQDVFGWRDRINEPATVNEVNWTYRLPWPSDRLNDVPAARATTPRPARVGQATRPRLTPSRLPAGRRRRCPPARDIIVASHGHSPSLSRAASESGRCGAHRRRSLRRRQRRRSARAGRGQPAELSARLASRARAAADTDPYGDAVYERAAENFSRVEGRGAGRRRRAERLFLSAADGRARADRAGRLLFARRIRRRHHQEARADAARQGRRPHAPHAGAGRADRAGVPDLPASRRGRRHRRADRRRRRRCSTSRRPTAFSTPCGASPAPIATRSSRRLRRCRRSTSPTATIARPARRGRATRCATAVSPARRSATAPTSTPCWPWRFRTTRRRSCPTTASSRIWRGRRRSNFSRRSAQRSRSRPGRRRPRSRGEIAMYFEQQWHTLRPRAWRSIRPIRSARSMSACCRTSCWRRFSASATSAPTNASISSAAPAAPRELEALVDQRQRGGGVLAVSGQRRRSHGGVRRRRDHAAQEHLVRAQAQGRPADPRDLTAGRRSAADSPYEDTNARRAPAHL